MQSNSNFNLIECQEMDSKEKRGRFKKERKELESRNMKETLVGETECRSSSSTAFASSSKALLENENVVWHDDDEKIIWKRLLKF